MTTAAIDDVLGDLGNLGDLDPWAAAATSDSEPASSPTSGATDAAPPLPARTSLSSKAQSAAESARSRAGQAGPSRPRSPSSPDSTTASAPASRQRSRAASGASATTASGLGVPGPSSSSPYNSALPPSPSPLSPLYQPPSGATTDAPRRRTRAGTGGSSSSAAGGGVTTSLGVTLTRPSRSASHPLAFDSAGLSPGDTASTGPVSALSMSPSGSAYGRAPRGVTATAAATAGSVSSPGGAAPPPPFSLGRLRDALAEEADPDVSRPSLRRVTSETERAVAESISQSQSRAESEGASERSDAAKEMVEVVVHLVRPAESLPGIALRYGVELAVLRKANKLWPSDPVNLRTKLYVPLDACRSSAAGVRIVRGPDEGQVTVIRHRKKPNGSVHTNGHSRDNSEPDLGLGTSLNDGLAALKGTVDLTPKPRPVDAMPAEHEDGNEDAVPGDTDTPEPVVLDLVRLPASQLRFFPRGKRRETARARASLDNEHGRSADSVRALSAMDAELRRNRHLERDRERARSVNASNLFAPLGAEAAAARAEAEAEAAASGVSKPKRPAVRLRPPQALPTAAPQTFAGRIQSLFSVPPPPVYPPLGRRVGSSASSSRRGSGGANGGAIMGGGHARVASESASPKVGEMTPPLPSGSVFAELLEMDARTPPPLQGSPRKTDKKRD